MRMMKSCVSYYSIYNILPPMM